MGHSHSPYSASCQSPTTASTYAFIASFLGALSSISLPTHITGYFLPTLPQTILLWLFVVFGLIYSGLTAAVFFRILEVAVGESYASGIVVDYRQRESGELEGKRIRKKLTVLRTMSWSSLSILMLLIASSIGLFILGWRIESEEWLEFCTTQALLVSTSPSPSSSPDSTAHSIEGPKLEIVQDRRKESEIGVVALDKKES
ncbi:hypothetical protein JCM3765_001848 [Sporobolomyces pararoseus]